MNLFGILAITGMPGLYKHIKQANNGLIIENIADGKRTQVFASARISALEDISMYTDDGDTRLSDIYRSLYKELQGKPTPFNPKKASAEELKELFAKVLPNYDQDRVYVSNIKTCFAWYNILVEKGYIDDKEDSPESEANDDNENSEDKPAEETPKRTRTRKKKTEE